MVSKQIRNARKPKTSRSKTAWPSLHALPEPSKSNKKPLPAMLRRAKGSEPLPKTIEIINGTPHFFIVMPCEVDKPKSISPLYLVELEIV